MFFGKLKLYSDSQGEEFKDQNEKFSNSTNRVRLSVDKDGNILVSFMLIPLIQKYTRNGQLIFEQRLEGPEIQHNTIVRWAVDYVDGRIRGRGYCTRGSSAPKR